MKKIKFIHTINIPTYMATFVEPNVFIELVKESLEIFDITFQPVRDQIFGDLTILSNIPTNSIIKQIFTEPNISVIHYLYTLNNNLHSHLSNYIKNSNFIKIHRSEINSGKSTPWLASLILGTNEYSHT